MIGPGNDSGMPDALIDTAYDDMMHHIMPEMVGLVALAVTDEEGDRGLVMWKYQHTKPRHINAAVHPDPLERLRVIFGAVKCARDLSEERGLRVMGG